MKHLEYFYVPPRFIKNNLVEIKGSEFKHLVVVSRKKKGDIVQVVDGEGSVYSVILTDITKTSAAGRIEKRSRYSGEPIFKLTLAQAIPKGNRFDFVIEKGTEIGVSKFIPLFTERSIVSGGESKLTRWQNLSIAAMKQCARSVLPQIASQQTLDQLLSSKGIFDFKLIAHPEHPSGCLTEIIIREKEKLSKITRIKNGIILIGPEGGFTTEEVNTAKQWGYQSFSLGSRRLRSETAAIVAAAIVMELVDNWIG